MEAAKQTVATLQESQSQHKPSTVSTTAVNSVPQHDKNNSKGQQFASYSSNKGQCWRCGNSNHTPARCKLKTVKCSSCGREGHIEHTCRQKKMAATSADISSVCIRWTKMRMNWRRTLERVHIHAVTDKTVKTKSFKLCIDIQQQQCRYDFVQHLS